MKLPNASELKPYPTMKDSGVGWIGDAPKRQRRSIRLQGYDYTRQGAYFVTICTRNRACLLGDIVEGRMHLSEAGRLAQAVWEDLPYHYPHVQIDVWVIMPNHMHGIVILTEAQATEDDMQSGADPKTDVGAKYKINVGAGFKPAPHRRRHPPRPVRNRQGLQDLFGQTHQRLAQYRRYAVLAAQLLRARYPERIRAGSDSAIHRG